MSPLEQQLATQDPPTTRADIVTATAPTQPAWWDETEAQVLNDPNPDSQE